MKKNTSGQAVYSFPGEEKFYQICGDVEILHNGGICDREGFVFSPFDKSDSPIVKINGESELAMEGMGLLSNRDLPVLEHPPQATQYEAYEATVEQIIQRIRSGHLDKLVFSISEVEGHSIDDYEGLLRKLRYFYPNAFVYYFYTPQTGVWIGASPELLLQSDGHKVETVALAGTLKNAPSLEDWGDKEIKEHRFVELFLEEQLGSGPYYKQGPYPIKAGPVFHLSSHYEILAEHFGKSPFDIHPGPALSGYPVKESIEIIKELENRPRKYYSGFLGPVSGDQTFRLYINLRCMEVYQNHSVMYAGGGITRDSNAGKEWAELQHKFSTLRSKMLKAEQV